MKRVLALLFAAGAAFMLPAMSAATPAPEESEQCAADDNAGPIHVAAGTSSNDSGRVVLCNDDGDFPLEGTIALSGDASQQCAVAVIDGDAGNPEVDLGGDGKGDLDGYAAIEIDPDRQMPVFVENFGDGDYVSDCPAD